MMKNFELYPHQQTALDETKEMNRVAYYLDMGLGKTFVGSEKLISFGTKYNIMICQKTKIIDWIEHFESFYPGLKIIDFTQKGAKIEPGLIIINYDLAFRRPELLKVENFTLMLDESSIIQNETTKRSKFVLKLNSTNVILLSGTPTSGKYENLWSQLHLLGWKISKDLYWKQYIEVEWLENDEGFPIRRVAGYKNVDRLKAKLRQHGAIFMKSEEVFDLPEMITIRIPVKSTKEYRKFVRSSIVEIGGIELIGDTTLTKRLYCRMLCGHYNQDKLDAVKDLIDSTEERLIMFYNFNDELEAIMNLVGERPVSIINGSIKDLSAYEDHDDSITLVQYQAGAMGLNLQKANRVIYFTLTERSELFEQSKKRIHRIGQTKRCFYYFPMVLDSVEEDIFSNLEMRRDYNDELFKVFEKS